MSYILQGYGISTDTIPITFSGTVKVTPMKHWIRLRQFLEEPLYRKTGESQSIIECPRLNDIVFRQGTSLMAHPGNATFRAVIASKFEMIYNSYQGSDLREDLSAETGSKTNKKAMAGSSNKDKNSNNNTVDKCKTRAVAEEVLDETQKMNGRFLTWHERQGSWKVLTDETQIYLKIEYLVRDHRNMVKALLNTQKIKSSTSIFCKNSRSRSIACNKFIAIENKQQGPKKHKAATDDDNDTGTAGFAECFGKKFVEWNAV